MGILTNVFLPLALAIIMLGMGLSLLPEDFRRIAKQPKAIIWGLLAQLVFLPIIGFGLIQLFGLTGTLAAGTMLLAACPGGATSNLIAHLAKGDTALSVSLTAFSSIVTVFTIPLLVNFSLNYYGLQGDVIELPFLKTVLQIFVITLLPVLIGMWIRQRYPNWALDKEPLVRKVSVAFFVLIIAAALIKERANIVNYFQQAGTVALALNVSTMAFAFASSYWLLRLTKRESITVGIEAGIQNGTLGITIAATMLKNDLMTIPSAIYSLIMFATAWVVIYWSNKT